MWRNPSTSCLITHICNINRSQSILAHSRGIFEMVSRKRIYTGKDGKQHVKRRRLSFKRWQEIRFKIWCRDLYRCVHCGERVSFKKAHIDHRIPICDFGTDRQDNLRCLCVRCHSLRRDPSHDKLRRKSFDKGIIPKNFIDLLWDD